MGLPHNSSVANSPFFIKSQNVKSLILCGRFIFTGNETDGHSCMSMRLSPGHGNGSHFIYSRIISRISFSSSGVSIPEKRLSAAAVCRMPSRTWLICSSSLDFRGVSRA